ncbi:MAG: hypothetical protein KDN22_21580 [Verrucomicrobiae bacterium]|nr:hypothetical protein [Verrucomicrobiae bacterium]
MNQNCNVNRFGAVLILGILLLLLANYYKKKPSLDLANGSLTLAHRPGLLKTAEPPPAVKISSKEPAGPIAPVRLLGGDGILTTGAVSLLGLTPQEAVSLQGLLNEWRQALVDIAKTRIETVSEETGNLSYKIKPFPIEYESSLDSFCKSASDLLGSERFDLLLDSMKKGRELPSLGKYTIEVTFVEDCEELDPSMGVRAIFKEYDTDPNKPLIYGGITFADFEQRFGTIFN